MRLDEGGDLDLSSDWWVGSVGRAREERDPNERINWLKLWSFVGCFPRVGWNLSLISCGEHQRDLEDLQIQYSLIRL